MTPESQLLEAIRRGDIDEVRSLLKQGVDVRHGDDAALREAAVTGDPGILRAILWTYPDEATREEAVNAVQSSLEEGIRRMRNNHNALVGRRKIAEIPTPEIEI